MDWTQVLVEYYCEHYYQLIDYELNPFEEVCIFMNEPYITGKGHSAPYEETCDLNWEFDKALKKLGAKEQLFREIYLDGKGELQPELFNEFCKILFDNYNQE